jgi:hypothetical protein
MAGAAGALLEARGGAVQVPGPDVRAPTMAANRIAMRMMAITALRPEREASDIASNLRPGESGF